MRVVGHSMLPLLRPGTVVLVDEGSYRHRSPRLGEVVAARPPALGGRACVKRIVGLPSERVTADACSWHLGPDEYFMAGDRTDDSLDSRTVGPVTRSEVIGRVWLRLWPPAVLRSAQPSA